MAIKGPVKVPLRRKFHVAAGKAKAAFLPKSVALVVHKPRYPAYAGVVNKVYMWHGIVPVHSRKRRFTKGKVRETYDPLFRAKPDVKGQVMDTFSSHGLLDRNIKVELVHVPMDTVRRLGAKNARHAMKLIAGETDPKKARKADEDTGVMTLRGEAERQHSAGMISQSPDIMSNVVHVPDHEISVQDGWPTGFEPDLHLFVTARDILGARANIRRLKRQKRIVD